MQRGANERGATAIIVAAIVLPIAIMLFAGLLDLSRAPLSRYGLRNALSQAVFDVDQELPLVASNNMIQSALPAANNLDSHIATSGNQDTTLMTSSGMLNGNNAAAIAKAACKAAGRRMNDSYSSMLFMNFSDTPAWAFQFAVVTIDTKNGGYVPYATLQDDSDCFAGTSFSAFFADANIGYAAVLKTFIKGIGKDTDGTEHASWPLQNTYSDAKSEAAGASSLPSAWLVGVGYMQVENMLGTFFSDKPRIINAWYMRPLGAAAGIQGSWYKEPAIAVPIE